MIQVNPAPGALVAKGSAVTIVVSTGPEPVTVASVIGQTEGRARNRLTEDGLVVRVIYQDVNAGSPDDGRVIALSLSAGSLTAPRHRDHDHRRPVGAGADHGAADRATHDRGPDDGATDHRRADHRGAHHRRSHRPPSRSRQPSAGRRHASSPERRRASQVRARKLRSMWWPCSVRMLSGWNCTPSTAWSR